jgi:hypothetical protein
LTNTEIDWLLSMLHVPNAGGSNKRSRLWAALMTKQQADQASNCIIRLITDPRWNRRATSERQRRQPARSSPLRRSRI